jgi:hypothetical protein
MDGVDGCEDASGHTPGHEAHDDEEERNPDGKQDEIIEEYQERLEELTQGDDPRTLTGARAEALRKLQEEEIAVSLADLECQLKHTDDIYHEVETEVYGQPLG